MSERIIFHIDMNNFFASVEAIDRPDLCDRAFAVCGETELRHGIVLAKNQIAKGFGIKTGEPVFAALKKCPSLTVVSPHYEKYEEISRCAKALYETYTDRVESFGIDECWCDMTGTVDDFKQAERLADEIREKIRSLLHVTVSVGVSFNKAFAKLGSDMKKPDATTVITRSNYRDKVWCRPAGELLFVGSATEKRLSEYSINTVGDIANADTKFLSLILGKNGLTLHSYANGADTSQVALSDTRIPPKSISRSHTAARDMRSSIQLKALGAELSDEISSRLRSLNMLCSTVEITIKDTYLHSYCHQCRLEAPTDRSRDILAAAMKLVSQHYREGSAVRAFGIQTSELSDASSCQLKLDVDGTERKGELEDVMFSIRARFGDGALRSAVQLLNATAHSPAACERISVNYI